jgi:hypothetical protein
MTDSNNSGYIIYSREGYSVKWDENGLKIEANDYHAGCLQLSWDRVLDLAKRASEYKSDNGRQSVEATKNDVEVRNGDES